MNARALFGRRSLSLLPVVLSGLLIWVLPTDAAFYYPSPDQLNRPIPASGSGGPGSTPTFSDNIVWYSAYETITDVNVHLTLAHPADGELIVSLIAPDGTQILLSDQRGGSGAGFTNTVFDTSALQPISAGAAPFTGSFQPEVPLSLLNGDPLRGVWRLKIEDTMDQKVGTLLSWALEITTVTNEISLRSNPQWTVQRGGTRIATDTFSGPDRLGCCFLVYANKLFTIPSETNSSVSIPRWTNTLGGNILGAPVPALFYNDEFVFVAAANGFLYKCHANNGQITWSRDFRRPSCPLQDVLAGSMLVQPYEMQNEAFQQAFAALGFGGSGALFLASFYGCGANGSDQVFALPWGTGNVDTAWTSDGSDPVAHPYGMALDAASNTLFVTCDAPLSVFPSVWAINTLDGTTKWSADVGPIRTKPLLVGNSLYVATYGGSLVLLDPANGDVLDTYPVTGDATISKDFEYASEGPVLLVTDDFGEVHGAVDVGGYFESAWPAPALPSAVSTSPCAPVGTGKFYVGLANGKICQCDLFTGLDDAEVTVGSALVEDLILDSNTGVVTNRLLACTSGVGGSLKRLYIPFVEGTTDGRSSGLISSDLAIEPVPGPDTVAIGQTFTYGFNVFNYGTDEVRPVWVTNTIPAGLTLNSVTLSQGSYSLSPVTGNELIINLDGMTNDATATIVVNVTAANVGVFDNIARVATSVPSFYEAQPVNDACTNTLTVVLIPVRFKSIVYLPNGHVRLKLEGAPTVTYGIESSPDLKNWERLNEETADGNGDFEFEDPRLPSATLFYRAVWP